LKLVIFFFLVLNIFSIDQDINQITGGNSEAPKDQSKQTGLSEMELMKKELDELKKEVKEIKNREAKPPNNPDDKVESESKETLKVDGEVKDISEKKEDTSVLNKTLDGKKEEVMKENQITYTSFNRDLFMQLQTADFKKGIKDRYQWQITFWNHGNYSNNSDLRKLDNTNQTSVDNTDDKTRFVAGGLQFDNFFPIHPRLDLRFDVWRFGFWGGDQLAGRDSNNDVRQTTGGANTVNFGQLYIDAHLKLNPSRQEKLSLRVGRQDYRIGGKIFRDYYQDDILDAVVLKWYNKKLGRLDLLLIDVFSNAADTKDVNFIRFLSFENNQVKNFDGRSATTRHGFNYRLPIIGESEFVGTHLDIRVFSYLSSFSGTNQPLGGADRTNNGTSGNFIDRDFATMRGVRLNGGYSNWFRSSFTVADSSGVDRKLPTIYYENKDVGNSGKSFAIDLEFSAWNRRVRFMPTYFYADGGRYYADGTQYSHGFVSMKGDQVGGYLSDLNWGMHPSAYTSGQGIADLPYNRDRRSGTEKKHLGFAFGILENLFLKLDWWRLTDTSEIAYLNSSKPSLGRIFSNEDSSTTLQKDILINAYQYVYPSNQTVIKAARRFGTPIGEEYNIGLDWNVFRGFKVWTTFAVLRPMRYFTTQGLVQGSPEGSTPFVGFQLGTSLIF
jgi:hypothetical protein